MNITPNEIASVEEAGELHNSPVKMIKTKGGFWIAVGKANGRGKEEALAAGSHPAIVKYNMEKQFPDFHPSMMKSEMYNSEANVDKHSHFLSDDLRKAGYDIFSVQEGSTVAFHITLQNVQKHEVTAHMSGKDFVVNLPKSVGAAFARGMAGAVTEKALALKAENIKVAGK